MKQYLLAVHHPEGDIDLSEEEMQQSFKDVDAFNAWVIQAPDLDAALALAAKGSEACRLPVEVRPFQENPGD